LHSSATSGTASIPRKHQIPGAKDRKTDDTPLRKRPPGSRRGRLGIHVMKVVSPDPNGNCTKKEAGNSQHKKAINLRKGKKRKKGNFWFGSVGSDSRKVDSEIRISGSESDF